VFCNPKGKPLRPTYANSGTWLWNVNKENLLCACFTRAVLNHAPTGKYYRRFHIPSHETHKCECGCPMQTRHHILTQCGVLDSLNHTPHYVRELIGYLVDNPKAFAFGFQYTHPWEGDG
jgi:hypothetical protein